MMSSSVDLPAPFGPIRKRSSPWLILTLRSLSTLKPSKLTVTPRTSMMKSPIVNILSLSNDLGCFRFNCRFRRGMRDIRFVPERFQALVAVLERAEQPFREEQHDADEQQAHNQLPD